MKYLAIFITLFISTTGIVSAEQTTYKQQILPIDCVYEVIDVGTQKLRYLTPETCPVDPGPPVITEPPIETTPDTVPDSNWTYYAPIEIIKPTQNTPLPNNDNEQVMGATEQIRDVVYRNRDGMVFISAVTLVWLATLFVLKKKKILS